MPNTTPPPAIRLRTKTWRQLCAEAGVYTAADRADLVGVARSAMCAVEAGERAPSAEFICGVLNAFPTVDFKDLFLVRRYTRRTATEIRGVA